MSFKALSRWTFSTLLALALSLGLSILRELVAITPSVDAALPWRLLDRAVPAAAGVLVGLWPVDVAGLLTFDWRNALVAAGFAALSAALAYVWTPPAYAHLSEDGTPAITNLPEVAGDDDVHGARRVVLEEAARHEAHPQRASTKNQRKAVLYYILCCALCGRISIDL